MPSTSTTPWWCPHRREATLPAAKGCRLCLGVTEPRQWPEERALWSAAWLGVLGEQPLEIARGRHHGREEEEAWCQGPGPRQQEGGHRASPTGKQPGRPAEGPAPPTWKDRRGENGKGCPGHSPPARGAQAFPGSRSLQADPAEGNHRGTVSLTSSGHWLPSPSVFAGRSPDL